MTLAQVTKKILISDPFYGFVLMSLNKCFDVKAYRAGIRIQGIGYSIDVDPDFWSKLTDEQQIEVMKHELLHACLFHLLMIGDYSNHELFNIACDAEVNQYLKIDVMNSLPGGCIDILQMFPGIKPRAGVKYYYEYLIRKQQANAQNPQKPCNGGQGGEDGEENPSQSNSPSSGQISDCVKNHINWKVIEGMSETEKELIKNQVDFILNGY